MPIEPDFRPEKEKNNDISFKNGDFVTDDCCNGLINGKFLNSGKEVELRKIGVISKFLLQMMNIRDDRKILRLDNGKFLQ